MSPVVSSIDDGPRSSVLKQVEVQSVSPEECSYLYRNEGAIMDSELCAWAEDEGPCLVSKLCSLFKAWMLQTCFGFLYNLLFVNFTDIVLLLIVF